MNNLKRFSPSKPTKQFVVFLLDNECYGAEIHQVHEIILMQPITRIPQSPAFMEGVISKRDFVIPVVNLASRLGCKSDDLEKKQRIVVAEVHGQTIGLIVDKVEEVLTIAVDAIEEPPLMAKGIGREYIQGIAKRREQMVIILDLQKLFAAEEIDEFSHKK
jgi:purine-binding chemotaxis protein CheW